MWRDPIICSKLLHWWCLVGIGICTFHFNFYGPFCRDISTMPIFIRSELSAGHWNCLWLCSSIQFVSMGVLGPWSYLFTFIAVQTFYSWAQSSLINVSSKVVEGFANSCELKVCSAALRLMFQILNWNFQCVSSEVKSVLSRRQVSMSRPNCGLMTFNKYEHNLVQVTLQFASSFSFLFFSFLYFLYWQILILFLWHCL